MTVPRRVFYSPVNGAGQSRREHGEVPEGPVRRRDGRGIPLLPERQQQRCKAPVEPAVEGAPQRLLRVVRR